MFFAIVFIGHDPWSPVIKTIILELLLLADVSEIFSRSRDVKGCLINFQLIGENSQF